MFQNQNNSSPFTCNKPPGPKDLPKLELELRKNNVGSYICDKKIDRIKADIEVIRQVRMKEEKNGYRIIALAAKIGELEAQIESEKFKMDVCSLNIFNIHMAIESIIGAEPESVLPYNKMHYQINAGAPEQYMAPAPSRF